MISWARWEMDGVSLHEECSGGPPCGGSGASGDVTLLIKGDNKCLPNGAVTYWREIFVSMTISFRIVFKYISASWGNALSYIVLISFRLQDCKLYLMIRIKVVFGLSMVVISNFLASVKDDKININVLCCKLVHNYDLTKELIHENTCENIAHSHKVACIKRYQN